MRRTIGRLLLGRPRDIGDPSLFHKLSLIALLAWVGLGADGLSSSSYGPDEAFRALGAHTYLAVALAAATALTVLVISLAYSQIIAHFPLGGGGYVVASRLLGPSPGVISGSALLVDYMLTIAVSVASAADQIFSALPQDLAPWKLPVEGALIGLLVVLNLRGVKESVSLLAPIFLLFLVTHAVLIGGGIGGHAAALPAVAQHVGQGFQGGLATLGLAGMFAVFLRAYAMGAGTYTGIEAVSNGIQIMREPRVRTARRTMTYMAVSLAVTAGGILTLYLLFQVTPVAGKTMNAALLERFAGGWRPLGLPAGHVYVVLTLVAEAALLVVAAQAGFIDGPRVMSNMAIDSWLPHRFAQLSTRLAMQNGVLIMGGAAFLALLYTRGSILALVTMYSINVFVTFSLSQLGMLRFWWTRIVPGRRRGLLLHGVAFVLCASILLGVVIEKGAQGGWVTLLLTSLVVALCFRIRRHYREVRDQLADLTLLLPDPPEERTAAEPLDPRERTAVLMVGSYSGLGMHSLLDLLRLFPGMFRQVVFVSVGVVDAGVMKGVEEVERVRTQTRTHLDRYVQFAREHGIIADSVMAVGTDPVEQLERVCRSLASGVPDRSRVVFFASRLVFEKERWYHRILHNETAIEIQRRLQFAGLYTLVLPVRLPEAAR